jgi:hypothetical protein
MPQGKQSKTSRGLQAGPELDKKTADLLQMFSAPAGTIGQFMPGTGGRIMGDLALGGSQKPQLAMAFEKDMPRDARMNSLLSAGATLGLDLTTDVGLKALMAFLATKGVGLNPAAQSGIFAAKGYGMNPIYNAMNEKIFDNNLGEKAADATKFADTHLNQGKMQAQYAELLPLLEMISQQPGAADNVTDLGGYALQKQKKASDLVTDPLRAMLPKNVQPTVDMIGKNVNDLANTAVDTYDRSIAGGKRDLQAVGRGVSNVGKVFQQQLKGFLSGKR